MKIGGLQYIVSTIMVVNMMTMSRTVMIIGLYECYTVNDVYMILNPYRRGLF